MTRRYRFPARLIAGLILAAFALVGTSSAVDVSPRQTRGIPITNALEQCISTSITVTTEALGAAVDTTHVTLGASAQAIANRYSGAFLHITCPSAIGFTAANVRIKSNTVGKVALVDATLGGSANATCTYEILPEIALPPYELHMGGCASTCYIAEGTGLVGTAGQARISLAAGAWFNQTFTRNSDAITTYCFYASVANDTMQVISVRQ